jgi:uncharacterized cupin superfamily protein
MPSNDPVLVAAIAADDDLQPAPINATWIKSGNPTTRSRRVVLVDDADFSGTIWETTAARFEWHYGPDELVWIVEGEVEITSASGRTFTARAGDAFFVPGGQVLQWNVPVYVKKLALNAVHVPPLRRLATRVPFARQIVRRLRPTRSHA